MQTQNKFTKKEKNKTQKRKNVKNSRAHNNYSYTFQIVRQKQLLLIGAFFTPEEGPEQFAIL